MSELKYRGRIADGATADAISEIKNVKRLGCTLQIIDGVTHAVETGREFHLYTRRDTVMTENLKRLISHPELPVVHRFIP